jgi:hypothetical protein
MRERPFPPGAEVDEWGNQIFHRSCNVYLPIIVRCFARLDSTQSFASTFPRLSKGHINLIDWGAGGRTRLILATIVSQVARAKYAESPISGGDDDLSRTSEPRGNTGDGWRVQGVVKKRRRNGGDCTERRLHLIKAKFMNENQKESVKSD